MKEFIPLTKAFRNNHFSFKRKLYHAEVKGIDINYTPYHGRRKKTVTGRPMPPVRVRKTEFTKLQESFQWYCDNILYRRVTTPYSLESIMTEYIPGHNRPAFVRKQLRKYQDYSKSSRAAVFKALNDFDNHCQFIDTELFNHKLPIRIEHNEDTGFRLVCTETCNYRYVTNGLRGYCSDISTRTSELLEQAGYNSLLATPKHTPSPMIDLLTLANHSCSSPFRFKAGKTNRDNEYVFLFGDKYRAQYAFIQRGYRHFIKEGDEITINYNTPDGLLPFECKCGSTNCSSRNTVSTNVCSLVDRVPIRNK
jgi:hypothetical protein